MLDKHPDSGVQKTSQIFFVHHWNATQSSLKLKLGDPHPILLKLNAVKYYILVIVIGNNCTLTPSIVETDQGTQSRRNSQHLYLVPKPHNTDDNSMHSKADVQGGVPQLGSNVVPMALSIRCFLRWRVWFSQVWAGKDADTAPGCNVGFLQSVQIVLVLITDGKRAGAGSTGFFQGHTGRGVQQETQAAGTTTKAASQVLNLLWRRKIKQTKIVLFVA